MDEKWVVSKCSVTVVAAAQGLLWTDAKQTLSIFI